MTVLELDSIGVSYGLRRVLTAASLRAPAGRVTALVGLQPLEHGTVRLGGKHYRRPRLATLARAGLFYLPATNILDPFIAVQRQLTAVSRYFGGPRIPDLLARFGLAGVATQAPASLSGGELRRAELALAAARHPTCLVADEPFRGLDPRDIEVLVDAIRSIAAGGAAVVVTGHELAALRQVADGVVWCVAGTTHEFPEASGAWADAQMQQEFLGPAHFATRSASPTIELDGGAGP